MRRTMRHLIVTAPVAAALFLFLSGCFAPGQQAPGRGARSGDRPDLLHRERFKTRPPINTTRNLYEGSLWRGAASWGNLMRDHRARYRGDLLTVTDITKIINVPEPQVEPVKNQQEAAAKKEQKEEVDPVIAFLRLQEKARQKIEREQNEILRSISSIELEVVEVLPNGNLRVRGAHPPIFRDRGRVKYIVSLQGIVRPSDVDDNNSISALKLSKAEYNVRRLVKRSALAGTAVQGAPPPPPGATGQFLDRLSNFLTAPGKSAGNPVN